MRKNDFISRWFFSSHGYGLHVSILKSTNLSFFCFGFCFFLNSTHNSLTIENVANGHSLSRVRAWLIRNARYWYLLLAELLYYRTGHSQGFFICWIYFDPLEFIFAMTICQIKADFDVSETSSLYFLFFTATMGRTIKNSLTGAFK